jgi:preprotein translocase subunit SecA
MLLQLSESTLAAARSAVKAATALWGSQALPLLEAEDRLSVACEKGDTSDEVLLQLRRAYQVKLIRLLIGCLGAAGFFGGGGGSCM